MPKHANSTTFRPGYQRSETSIEKQRQTLRQRFQETGRRPHNFWSEETRTKYRTTWLAKAYVCDACGETYAPTSNRQRWCRPCGPTKSARSRLMRYGISQPDWDRRVAAQGGVCAICRVVPPTVVDHCHDSLKIRGALCYSCNFKLAGLEAEHWIDKALDYLGW